MNDDLRPPASQPLLSVPSRDLATPAAIASALPVGAFTASVLLDVLSLVADGPEHARSYARGAVDALKVGIGASIASLALGLLEAIDVPPATPAGKAATKALALDGAIVAVYLLDLAAREKQLSDGNARPGNVDAAAIGFSLTGLALLAISGKLRWPPRG